MPTCEHKSTVSVVESGSVRGKRAPTTICRDCHAMKRHLVDRWVKQPTPTMGAAMMPIVWGPRIPSDCFEVPAFDNEPPFLLPTVPAAFARDLVVGQRAAFLGSYCRRQWIEGTVRWIGENEHGERGFVATTEQGLTLRGNEGAYSKSWGGGEFWGVNFFGGEVELAEIIAIQRAQYPREVVPRLPSSP